MRVIMCIVIALAGGCLASSLASMGCDWHQTRSHAGSYATVYERNPILGDTPSAARIDIYFATAALLVTVADVIFPRRYHPYLHTAVTSVEAHASWFHMRTITPGVCGWR